MLEGLLGLTALVLVVGMIAAYGKNRDILHPLVFLGPLFLYAAVIDPWFVRGALGRFFANPDDVAVVLALNRLVLLHSSPVRFTSIIDCQSSVTVAHEST
jgi:hypothetical protein